MIDFLRKSHSMVRRIGNYMLDIIYPPKCIFCGSILPPETTLEICPQCYKKVPFIQGDVCVQCGQPLDKQACIEYCTDCSKGKHYFVQGISVFEYRDRVKKSIVGLKFYHKKRYAATLGQCMAKRLSEMTHWPIFNIVVYTPLHKKRLVERGYNQAQLLARTVAQELDIPLGKDVLFKTKHTGAQSKLTRAQRQINLYNTFGICTEALDYIKGAVVLLVDDVYTTGATVNECARLLQKAGARQIYVVTAAIGKGTY